METAEPRWGAGPEPTLMSAYWRPLGVEVKESLDDGAVAAFAIGGKVVSRDGARARNARRSGLEALS